MARGGLVRQIGRRRDFKRARKLGTGLHGGATAPSARVPRRLPGRPTGGVKGAGPIASVPHRSDMSRRDFIGRERNLRDTKPVPKTVRSDTGRLQAMGLARQLKIQNRRRRKVR